MASPSVVRVVVRDRDLKPIGQGSGFFVSSDGLVVTNWHVIKDAEFATVLLNNGGTLFVKGVKGIDRKADLALLEVNGKNLPHLAPATGSAPMQGTRVYAIGNPLGLTNTFSEGMISGLRRISDGLVMLQTNTAISKGSSGGPLLTANGEVVGVTTAYLTGGQNLNFAAPASAVRRLLASPGKLRPLASAAGKSLDRDATALLDKAWQAMRKEDWRAATAILSELRKKDKSNPFVWFTLGYLHGELGNYEIAVENYEKAISLRPDFAPACFNLGLALYWSDRKAAAERAFRKVSRLRPRDAKAHYWIGVIFQEAGRTSEAVAAFKRSAALDPEYAAPHCGMGRVYLNLKRHNEAVVAFKKAIAIKPDFVSAYIGMGFAQRNLGKTAEAVRAFRTAERLDRDGILGRLASKAAADIASSGARRVPSSRAIREGLKVALPKVNFNLIQLGNAVQFLRDVGGIAIYVDWKALEELGVRRTTLISMKMENKSVLTVIQAAFRSARPTGKVGYMLQGEVLVVSTDQRVRAYMRRR